MFQQPFKIFEEFINAIDGKEGYFEKWMVYADILLTQNYKGVEINNYDAYDIVSEVMLKFAEGKRKWDTDKFEEINCIIYKNIKSFIDNLSKKEIRSVSTEKLMQNYDNDENTVLDIMSSEQAETIEEEIETKDILEKCLDDLADDTVSGIALLEFSKGKTNKEVAEYLGLDVKSVENCKKRIKRKARKYFPSY
jgi:RNA polymerase sigma factor (sigma-70 family)